MARVHMVLLSKLAALAWRLNAEIERGATISVKEAEDAIKTEKVILFLKNRFGQRFNGSLILDLGLLDEEDDITISEFFSRQISCLSNDQFGIKNNGLSWLLVLTVEMIAKQEWTTYT
jgi:hypothetical protein